MKILDQVNCVNTIIHKATGHNDYLLAATIVYAIGVDEDAIMEEFITSHGFTYDECLEIKDAVIRNKNIIKIKDKDESI